MQITAEISLYALGNEYAHVIEKFVENLAEREQVSVEIGVMSSLIRGEYHDVIRILEEELFHVFEKGHAAIQIKIANACEVS